MDELTGILIALGALFGGLGLLSWACGDFNPPKVSAPSKPDGPPPASGQ